MKKINDISVSAVKADALSIKADLLAVGMFEDKTLSAVLKKIDRQTGGALQSAVGLNDFSGQAGSSVLFYGSGKSAAKRILLIGLGDRKKADSAGLRKAASLTASKAAELKVASLTAALHEEFISKELTAETAGQVMAEGLLFGAYRYDEYMTEKNRKNGPLPRIKAVVADSSEIGLRGIKKGMAVGRALGEAQNYARTLANRPANVITPMQLAAEARKVARGSSLKATVFMEKQLQDKRMGGILAVGQGSVNKPVLIVLKYTPAGSAASKKRPVALVGKAITFDSGGISIKPGAGMEDMKFDKSGGIAVLGAMKAIAQLKPKVPVVGLIPSAENMPGGRSYRPGDIVTTYSKKTVEIQNTDAEGRMILCDALHYATADLNCSPVVDICTLTGACVVAIGTKRAGLMGNDETLVEQLKEASGRTGERVWHLPCDDEYVEAMKSKIADLKNTGGKWAGACTAAGFLSQFVGEAKWAHVDMAGVGVWGAGEQDAPGSIGFGVRLLSDFAMNQ